MDVIGRMITEHAWYPGEGVLMGMGATVFFGFLLSPAGLASLYFAFEGMVRAVSGAVGEPTGTLPLALIDEAASRLLAGVRRIRGRRPVPDGLVPDGRGGWMIATCRPRSWTALTTIRFERQLFRLEEFRPDGPPPRPYRYRVRPIGPDDVVRGVEDYAPDDPQRSNRPRWRDGWRRVLGALRRRLGRRPPRAHAT